MKGSIINCHKIQYVVLHLMSEHYYAIFITWTDSTNGINTVVEYLIYFGFADDVDEATNHI